MQDEIGWGSAHIVGFSMGGMVAAKFSALWPQRVSSLSIISSTRGGWDTLPRSWRAWKYVLRLARDKSPRTRARLDLKFHFTDRTLKQCAPRPRATRSRCARPCHECSACVRPH